jgi:serine/threonine protein kinase
MLGTHKSTGEKVAIKFVNPRAYGDASGVAAIYTEQESVRKLKHKNIISYLSSFMMNNYLVHIMEYCEGGELLDLLHRRGRLKERDAKTIFM